MVIGYKWSIRSISIWTFDHEQQGLFHTWWLIPLSGLTPTLSGWKPHSGYNPLTSHGMSHQGSIWTLNKSRSNETHRSCAPSQYPCNAIDWISRLFINIPIWRFPKSWGYLQVSSIYRWIFHEIKHHVPISMGLSENGALHMLILLVKMLLNYQNFGNPIFRRNHMKS